MTKPAALALAVLFAPPVAAEEVIFRCWFDWMCDPNTRCADAAEDIRFRVDVEANTVTRLGGNALSQFDLLFGDRALTVLERPVSGGTATTTIMLSNIVYRLLTEEGAWEKVYNNRDLIPIAIEETLGRNLHQELQSKHEEALSDLSIVAEEEPIL